MVLQQNACLLAILKVNKTSVVFASSAYPNSRDCSHSIHSFTALASFPLPEVLNYDYPAWLLYFIWCEMHFMISGFSNKIWLDLDMWLFPGKGKWESFTLQSGWRMAWVLWVHKLWQRTSTRSRQRHALWCQRCTLPSSPRRSGTWWWAAQLQADSRNKTVAYVKNKKTEIRER